MFKVTQTPTYWATVRASITAENGTRADVSFEVKFRRYSVQELVSLRERMGDPEANDAQIAREIVQDWRGVLGDDDQPLPFNEANLDQVIDLGMASAIGSAFWESQPRAKRKN